MPTRILVLTPEGSLDGPENLPDGWHVELRGSVEAVEDGWDLVLVDQAFRGGEGLAVAADIAAGGRRTVLVAASPSLQLTATALDAGIADVIPAPIDPEELRAHLSGAGEASADGGLPLAPQAPEGNLVGRSPGILRVFRTVARVSGSPGNVFFHGEPGTGKRALARFTHQHGARADGPFVELSCAALPDHLIESELFGHEEGTFPWAVAARRGRMERASGGILFLDHVDRMPLRLQIRLLEALRRGVTERVGGDGPIEIDVRMVSATTGDPERLEEDGSLLPDLRDELAAVTIELPPLRARGDDLLLLVSHFGALAAQQHQRPVEAVGPEARRKLETHDWPGNLRELRSVMEHAVLVADGPVVRSEHLPESVRWPGGAGRPDRVDREVQTRASLDEVEAAHIRRVLRTTHGNLSAVSEILGIHRNTLRRKIRKYGIPS